MKSYKVTFKKAVDNKTPQKELLYKLYISEEDNLNNKDTIEQNGTLLTSETNVDEFQLNVQTSIDVYINVAVKDKAGNINIYKAEFLKGDEDPIEPSDPIINNELLTVVDASTKKIKVNYDLAVDELTPQSKLLYYFYSSPTNNLDTVENTESNGIFLYSEKNTDTFTITNPTAEEEVWFNVIVENKDSKKSLYLQNSHIVPLPDLLDGSFVSNINFNTTKQHVVGIWILDGGTWNDIYTWSDNNVWID